MGDRLHLLFTRRRHRSLANAGVDRVLQDTYYVVAHFHLRYRSAPCSASAGWYTGSENVRLHVFGTTACALWFTFTASILCFPQHFLGLKGMPRRYVDYPDAFALEPASSLGSTSGLGVLIFIYGVVDAFEEAGGRSQLGAGATTLEWTRRRRRPSTSSKYCRACSKANRGALFKKARRTL